MMNPHSRSAFPYSIAQSKRRASGLLGFWWTKCWTGGDNSYNTPDAEKLVAQWRRFALASYLLAAGPHSHSNFDTRKGDQNAAEDFPE